ncbi:orotidine-5'-phosphate decarboxylase [Propionispora hippei DSM 15287]|uniref:Orotidine 5'-phosphate decarboxylase n=1 Tax=Propionispora hippei DSM 15287 TaxID=1123003 RepID=A0A1M6LQ01_9FIRM|nr:orotidine-5'-phosphate decarboxylase [Propionispora hippei]SHJ73230.1 orotidine-5'-phosphate decarboxylase [Propionispora hippei DSM 15287]
MVGDKRLIVALDVPNMNQVRNLVEKLGDSVSYYKVGMELYYSTGREVIAYLRSLNKDVFLDLKLHDIPNTVAQSLGVLTELGASMLNIHASGGLAMMKAASQAVANKAAQLEVSRPALIAVTVLTSIDAADWANLRHDMSIKEHVVHLAKLAQSAGIDGVVASPQEAEAIRAACGERFIIVTPGVRPQGAAINDQSRIATPREALKQGAHHLVIGRPITAAADPRTAALEICKEMEAV